MDYGALIREAWATTWRHRFLWMLGFFAGGGAAASGGGRGGVQWRGQPGDFEPAPELGQAAQGIAIWAAANVGLIAVLAIVGLALGLTLVVVSLIAQGGMAEATVDLASGRPSSLGRAWRTGVRLFWRYVGLWLSLIGLAILAAGVVGTAVAIVLALANLGAAWLAAAVLIGLPLALTAIAVAVGASIVVAFAQRAIFAEDLGPVAALGSGLRLLRQHPGTSALVWLVNLALGVGAGIATVVVVLAVLFVLGVPGFGLWAWVGFTAPTIAYAVVAALAVLAAGALVAAVSNTFFWSYWTLAYLQLTGRRGQVATD